MERRNTLEKTVALRAFVLQKDKAGKHWAWLVKRIWEAKAAYYAAWRVARAKNWF